MTKKIDILIYGIIIAIIGVVLITLFSKKEVNVTSITFDQNNINLYVGEKWIIEAKVTPENAVNKTLTWESNNPMVASVDDSGVVKANSEGEADIIVSLEGQTIKESCHVIVRVHDVEKIELDKISLNLKIGESYILKALALPESASYRKLNYKSTDENIVTVDANGNIVAKNSGSAEIIVSDEKNRVEARCQVLVGIPIEKIEIESTLEIIVGKEGKLNAILTPIDTTDTVVTWKSSDESIATVDSTGKVSAKKVGTATITATSADKSASCKVTVKREPILVTEVKISRTSASLEVGKTLELKAKVVPSNADNKNITWSSSDSSIASVNANGIVTARKTGTTTIVARSVEGKKTAVCKITVKTQALKPIVPSNPMIKFEGTTLKYYVQNNNRYYLTYIWMVDPASQIRKLDPNTAQYGKVLTDAEMDSKGMARGWMTVGDMMNAYIAKGIIPANKTAIGYNGGGFYVSGYWSPPSPYYDRRSSSWIVVNNGILTRNRINADDTPIDTIIGITGSGNLKSYGSGSGSAEKRQSIYNAIKADKVVNTWAFNPLLIGPGVDTSWWTQTYAQRNAICQINANNYVMFSSANGSSHYFELANIFKSIGCKTAMNLDGGGSTSFFIKGPGETSVTKIKCGEANGRCRSVIEGIYFTEK